MGDEGVCAAGEAWKVDGLWFVPGGKESEYFFYFQDDLIGWDGLRMRRRNTSLYSLDEPTAVKIVIVLSLRGLGAL